MSPRKIPTHVDGQGLGIGVVVAQFNGYVNEQMLQIVLRRLLELHVADQNIVVTHTPGAYEIPLLARRLACRDDIDAVICIGTVIRGETDHYDHISYAASRGISKASEESGKPVIFGVLTTENAEQAVARIGRASDYAEAAVAMANTMRGISELS